MRSAPRLNHLTTHQALWSRSRRRRCQERCGSVPRSFLAPHQVADERKACASDLSSTSKVSLKEDFSTADPTDLTSVGKADASNAGERAQPNHNPSTPC